MLISAAVWPQYMGQNWGGGAVPPFFGGERGPHLTQCRLGQGIPSYQVASQSIQPFWPQQTWAKNWGCLCPFLGSGSNVAGPTSVLSFILIHPTVWPQFANVTDRTDRQICDSIGRTVLQTVAQKPNFRIIFYMRLLKSQPLWPTITLL